MKKSFFIALVMSAVFAVSANAQVIKSIHKVDTERVDFGVKKHTLPLAQMLNRPNDTSLTPLYNYHAVIEVKDNKANGMGIVLKVFDTSNNMIKYITCVGVSTRLIKTPGLIRCVDANSIVWELTYDYEVGWMLYPYVRNFDGTPSQINPYFYHITYNGY